MPLSLHTDYKLPKKRSRINPHTFVLQHSRNIHYRNGFNLVMHTGCSVMVSSKGDTRAQRLPKETCRFGTDLKFADLQSVKSTKWINDFVASSNNQLVVSTDRYIFQMSALVTLLSKGPQVSQSSWMSLTLPVHLL